MECWDGRGREAKMGIWVRSCGVFAVECLLDMYGGLIEVF